VACELCERFSLGADEPRGYLHFDDLVAVLHAAPGGDGRSYLGHLLVCPRRHAEDFAALDERECGVVAVEIATWTRALKSLGATRVYLATIGHHVDHLHVHLLPRWPETPDEVAWHQVDEWPGARTGNVDEITSFVAEVAGVHRGETH
jgi:diadenosine tetraphosphate (Ap4A) HIT family hydrolase